jgi:putative FmdB family regulatory protein
MPLYEYFCESCDRRFELLRPMGRMDDAAECPSGHAGGKRVLSTFAAHTTGEFGESAPLGGCGGACGGGGCAGGACACSASMN